ncbi:hypothetical protein J9Z47_003961 [Salmonella enterica]|nr:hypothetical protein [Salmonella enterica]
MTSKSGNRYSPELRERAVRMVPEQRGEYSTIREAIHSIAPETGCSDNTLRERVKRHERGFINASNSNNASPLTSNGNGLRSRSAGTVSYDAVTISCVRHQRILRRQTPTTTGKNDATRSNFFTLSVTRILQDRLTDHFD